MILSKVSLLVIGQFDTRFFLPEQLFDRRVVGFEIQGFAFVIPIDQVVSEIDNGRICDLVIGKLA